MKTWISNAFSPSMLRGAAYVFISPLPLSNFVTEVKAALKDGRTECVIGHAGTARLLQIIINENIRCERKQISVDRGDVIYIISLAFRAPEGRVYSYDELLGLMRDGKIRFWRVEVLPGDCECTYKEEAKAPNDEEEVLGSIFGEW